MKIFTIGFTGKSAEKFFTTLKRAGVQRVLDVRLKNRGQLAGFTKRDDLQFFLKNLLAIEYVHVLALAPTKEMRRQYQESGNWPKYAREFQALLKNRAIEAKFEKKFFKEGCLLCSEAMPEFCHRKLICDYLDVAWGDIHAIHL